MTPSTEGGLGLGVLYLHTASANNALAVSSFGIYLHAGFVSLTLGLPLAILAWHRSGNRLYLKYAMMLTAVWAVNFALGVMIGTVVEFGLLEIWSASILLFSSSIFVSLFYEATIAFIDEAVPLGLLVLAIGRWRARYTLSTSLATWALGISLGLLHPDRKRLDKRPVGRWRCFEEARRYVFELAYGSRDVTIVDLAMGGVGVALECSGALPSSSFWV
jgi:hypothetical protein